MKVNFTDNLEMAMEILHKNGAFLTVKDGEKVNTMTISWGNVGFEWRRPIFTVLVRKSRYTHELIEKSDEFTVSIPVNKNLEQALSICGTRSGRDIDKEKEAGIAFEESKQIKTPIIAGCGIYYECKIVYRQEMNPNLIIDEIKSSSYNDEDYHTFYYGEIVDCYCK